MGRRGDAAKYECSDQKAGHESKKKTYVYRERDELKRVEFEERLKTKMDAELVYVDEAGIDNRDEYPYGYSKLGQRCDALKSGKRTERVSWIAALKQGKLFAPMTFSGSCNRDLFEVWLETCLLPKLQPGSVIIIDNASFHRSQAMDEIVAQAECELWYLPPYSPDLNKIERWWFVLKNWMRQRWDEFETFRDCVDVAFRDSPNVLRSGYIFGSRSDKSAIVVAGWLGEHASREPKSPMPN
ncbi:hypothetical protein NIES2135_07780 [Leptolyngbya boryana NIES-2135]|jgi:transposase|uniref:Tc1-like transposase DDE domain-containing protein n=1 Tax=Leptolyngbya boryana NIES-2135 TaxID=1973484 RepID=A0A1Z4JB01_LEPBY|nr:transposase [Leptolyngbya boryana IAM M-101]BAS66040.1 transposase [Leptolyngbya boryana dg5]BAY53965.1 hypothetical protein NIES2135_07780 [Leptolyngbya boryana NIES-2135]